MTVHAVQLLRRSDDVNWSLLPFQFERLDGARVVLTNMVGEHLLVSPDELRQIVDHDAIRPDLLARLEAKHLVRRDDDDLPIELLSMKVRTRHQRVAEFTSLHMFVVTLRCEHACEYCQVSRRGTGHHEYDMSRSTAQRSLDFVFRSPAPAIKIEFQGGEPLLNFDLVREIVHDASCATRTPERIWHS